VSALRPRNGKRPRAEFVGEHPVEVTFAVAEPTGETPDAVTFHDPVRDEPHRSGDDVLANVPLGRSRRRIRATSFAGPETVLLSSCRGREEVDVGSLRRDRRATRSTVDPRRSHAGDEPSVEALVAALHRDVTLVGIERRHMTIMPPAQVHT